MEVMQLYKKKKLQITKRRFIQKSKFVENVLTPQAIKDVDLNRFGRN